MTDATALSLGVSEVLPNRDALHCRQFNERINRRKSPETPGVRRRDRRSSPKKEPRKAPEKALRRRKFLLKGRQGRGREGRT